MNGRTRIWLALLIAALVVLSAVPALAKRVVNESHNEYQLQAWMGTDDGSANGGAWAVQGSNGEALGIDYSISYDCDGADDHALAFESINGEANLEVFTVDPTKGKTKYTDGFATGSFMDGSNYYWENCGGEHDTVDLGPNGPQGAERLTIDMDGTDGSLVKTSSSNSWHIPSETNNHRNDKGTMRLADAFVFIPGGILDWHGEGSVGQHSWSEHTNE